MASRKNQQNLNLSGFSPIQMNTYSPQSVKSPGKDYGINERIEVCKERLISGFDRWKLTESNGLQIINIIHNIKEKSRRTNEDVYPSDLETYCTKLKVVRTVCEDVINSLSEFHKEMKSSICIIESMNDNDELKERLKVIETFLSKLKQLYEINLEMKILVIENIAHAITSNDSQFLISSWSCSMNQYGIFKSITQLKVSPQSSQWITS